MCGWRGVCVWVEGCLRACLSVCEGGRYIKKATFKFAIVQG